MRDVASRGPDVGRAYPVIGAPGWGDWTPGSFPSRGRRGNGQIDNEILSAHALIMAG
jgi:hypothetical protein